MQSDGRCVGENLDPSCRSQVGLGRKPESEGCLFAGVHLHRIDTCRNGWIVADKKMR